MFARFNPFTCLTLLVLAYLPFASAWIDGISTLPDKPIAPGGNFRIVFYTSDYIQNNLQYYTIFGLKDASLPFSSDNTFLGTLLGNGKDLVTSGHSSTLSGNYSFSLTVPSTATSGTYVLVAAVLGTVGAEQESYLQYWNTTIQVS